MTFCGSLMNWGPDPYYHVPKRNIGRMIQWSIPLVTYWGGVYIPHPRHLWNDHKKEMRKHLLLISDHCFDFTIGNSTNVGRTYIAHRLFPPLYVHLVFGPCSLPQVFLRVLRLSSCIQN